MIFLFSMNSSVTSKCQPFLSSSRVFIKSCFEQKCHFQTTLLLIIIVDLFSSAEYYLTVKHFKTSQPLWERIASLCKNGSATAHYREGRNDIIF